MTQVLSTDVNGVPGTGDTISTQRQEDGNLSENEEQAGSSTSSHLDQTGTGLNSKSSSSTMETASEDSISLGHVLDTGIITKEMIEEEQKLNEEGSEGDDEWKPRSYSVGLNEKVEETAESRYEKLKCLLSKSELYSTYLMNRMKAQQAEAEKRLQRLEHRITKEARHTSAQDHGQEKEGQYHLRTIPHNIQNNKDNKMSERKRKAKSMNPGKEKANISFKRRKITPDDSIDSAVESDDNNTETPTTEEQVKIVNGIRTYKGEPVPKQQPHLFVGGVLRQYQVDGFNWLKSLYENGVNGILADEMGLGKTIQCISLVAYLIEQGINGPFFICGPLSMVPNWVSEFKRFTPKIPVVLYHGSKEERQLLRAKFHHQYPVYGDIKVRPVVITSYGIVINDRPYLMNNQWKLLIVDEGHRIKNFNCKLVTQLKMYRSSHRLLLTGTPLQNDLSELWSLLNFLLPEIFDDLGSFEAWFDLSILQSSECHEQIVKEEQKKNVLNMIHKILTPFMLRRLKSDVDLQIPPKGEVLVYARMTEMQANMYRAIIEGSVRSLVGCEQKEQAEAVCLNKNGRPVRRSSANVSYKHLLDAGGTDVQKEKKRKKRKSARAEDEFESWIESVRKEQEARENWGQPNNNKEKPSSEAEFNVQLRQVLALLRKACNHPYLIKYPLTKSGQYRIDEDLVRVSGKFLLLDRMLPELQNRGHKVLIFSQMTTTLDLLGDFCYLREWNYCRLDGSIQLDERQQQIKEFNTDPDTFIFLLSTRAGGLGINLTAADTVIIFDSDWNPQSDLQAQDRCHRIGQTKPVLVYRLVTPNAVDEKIVSRANAKRKLEKLVIHKGQFKKGLDQNAKPVSIISPEELANILQETNYDVVIDNEVISDENLNKLLDRSSLISEMRANKEKLDRGDMKTSCSDDSDAKEVIKVITGDVTDVAEQVDDALQSVQANVTDSNMNKMEKAPTE